ncbi:hypothetical protein [Streptomyces fragilis]|uniref:Uncharacterized protein n=1 Tax=Streptomyces fragilis TaxID=67301 RepID=A0ABV2YF32_9ACTN|nr:hypothetical protein [Streptomyces fragilis]
MPTDPSVIRLLAVLAVLLCVPLAAALGLRALELAGLLGAGRPGAPPSARPSVRLAEVADAAVRRPRAHRLRALAGCVLGASALASCAALAVVTAVRGQA